MLARSYAVNFTAVAVTAAQDFFELSPTDDKPIEIVGLFVGQYSDAGDAADELLPWSIVRGHTTSGSGGAAATPRPVRRSTGTAGFAAETNNTTIASAGTGVTIHSDAFNVRAGIGLWFPEGFEPDCGQGDTTIVVRLLTAPADSLTMQGTVYVREVG